MYSKYKTLTRLTEKEKKDFLEKKYPKKKEDIKEKTVESEQKKVTIEQEQVVKTPAKKKAKKRGVKFVLFAFFIVFGLSFVLSKKEKNGEYDSVIPFWLECGISREGMKTGLREEYGVSEKKAERLIDKYADSVNWYDQAVVRAQNCLNKETADGNRLWYGSPMVEQGEVALYNHDLFYDEMNYNGMVEVLKEELFTDLEAAYGAECIYGNEQERAERFAENYVTMYGEEGLKEAMEAEGFSEITVGRVMSGMFREFMNEFYQQREEGY